MRRLASLAVTALATVALTFVGSGAAQATHAGSTFGGHSATVTCHYHPPGIWTGGYWHCGRH